MRGGRRIMKKKTNSSALSSGSRAKISRTPGLTSTIPSIVSGAQDCWSLLNVSARLSTKKVIFFFFQAADGIRDLYVTGVQTCALPISPAGVLGGEDRRRAGVPAGAAR